MVASLKSKKGSILVMTLWTLSVLALFAVSIGVGVRKKIFFISRIERRNVVYAIAEAGIYKAFAVLMSDPTINEGRYTARAKVVRHNNPKFFKDISIGEGVYSVDYTTVGLLEEKMHFGVVDEERKININAVDVNTLTRLLNLIFASDTVDTRSLARAIIDWRMLGESEIEGFYSDEFYANLPHPYEAKKGPFETLDELKLVKGVSQDIYEKLISFVTVYGDGRVNINTASRQVLLALGISDTMVDGYLFIRRGVDGIENTEDDVIFNSPQHMGEFLTAMNEFEIADIHGLYQIIDARRLSAVSMNYSIVSTGKLREGNEAVRLQCVYNVSQRNVLYWKTSRQSVM